jgi:GT2 family glycosyltransferase
MASNKPKVLIAVPTMGQINTMLVNQIARWIAEAYNSKEYGIALYTTECVSPVEKAREEIVQEFLKSDCTHIFWVDSDTVPKPDALKKLLDRDEPIVSGLTAMIQYDEKRKDGDANGFYKRWNCVGMDDVHLQPNTGVRYIRGAGGSCIMVKREVYEKMKAPYYEFVYKDDNGNPTLISEDIYFIMKALKEGYKALCDTSVIAGHYKGIFWDL